jgi:uncharacterized protein
MNIKQTDFQAIGDAWREERERDVKAIDTSRLPVRVQARLKVAFISAQERALLANQRSQGMKATLSVMLRRAMEPRIGNSERIQRFWRLADLWNKSFETVSACKRGCNHCCHQSVVIPRAEALAIANATGKTLGTVGAAAIVPAQSIAGLERTQEMHKGVPCPMLVDGDCSIYANRPMTCRQLISLDVDELLCEIIPGEAVPVPYADSTQVDMAFAAHLGHDVWQDIRDWFPTDSGGTPQS